MLWLALHFPCFGLEVAERRAGLQPETAPRILVRDNRVIHCNPGAKDIGVRVGSTLATAQSLASEGATLEQLREDPSQISARLQLMASLLYRFSSEVSLDPPDAVVLEVGRSLGLFGDFSSLEQAVMTLCDQLGHQVVPRTSSTPSGALLLARSGSRQLAKVPLQALPVSEKQYERMANMGLRTFSQLQRLPVRELGQRFGQELVDYLGRVDGRLPDPREALVPAAEFNESLHLLDPIRGKQALYEPMQHLLEELCCWLTSCGLGAALLKWRFLSHHQTLAAHMPVPLSKPQQHLRAFFDVSKLHLERTALPEDVLGVGLEAAGLEVWQSESLTLFQGNLNDDHAQQHASEAELAELLDQLGARLGMQACMRLQSLDTHIPEKAWAAERKPRRKRPYTNKPYTNKPHTKRSHARHIDPRQAQRQAQAAPLRRPLWLFSPPRPIDVTQLRLLEGPERVQTGWWSQAVSRDYYVAEHTSGARCWAFREASSQWYLHGYFG